MMMNTIGGLLSPSLLAALSVVTLGAGGVLFLLARRSGDMSLDVGAPLSWAEPVELRLVLYFLLGAIFGNLALVLRLVLGTLGEPSVGAWLLLAVVVGGFIANLAFLYAAAGSLLQAALGTRGRPPFWFFSTLSALDGVVMDLGDIIAGILFHPAPARGFRRGRRHAYEDELGLEDDYVESRRYSARTGRPQQRSRTSRPHVYREDEYHLEPEYRADVPDYWDESTRPTERRTRRSAMPGVSTADDRSRDEELWAADELPTERGRRPRSGRTRDIPRERLEMALRQYEAGLNDTQRERLREMRSLVDSLKQCA